jgi:hypothetical protein
MERHHPATHPEQPLRKRPAVPRPSANADPTNPYAPPDATRIPEWGLPALPTVNMQLLPEPNR